MKDTVLQISSLTKSYDQGTTTVDVLRGIDLHVASGESVAIVGQSGSGKSTLLSLMAGLDRPSTGSIKMNQQHIETMDEMTLSRFRGQHMGIIFQQFHLMSSLNALENVLLPLEIAGTPQAKEKAEQALAKVKLSHRADHLPHQLSGGECQRVAIARAFVVQPSLLLADEPSGNLDDDTGELVMDLLFDMVREHRMSMILVTHDMNLARRCDRLLHLKHGTLTGTNNA